LLHKTPSREEDYLRMAIVSLADVFSGRRDSFRVGARAGFVCVRTSWGGQQHTHSRTVVHLGANAPRCAATIGAMARDGVVVLRDREGYMWCGIHGYASHGHPGSQPIDSSGYVSHFASVFYSRFASVLNIFVIHIMHVWMFLGR